MLLFLLIWGLFGVSNCMRTLEICERDRLDQLTLLDVEQLLIIAYLSADCKINWFFVDLYLN